MENPSTDVSSPGFLFRGKPSSTRSGPKGDIQRAPGSHRSSHVTEVNPIGKGIAHIEKRHAAESVLFHYWKQKLHVHYRCCVAADDIATVTGLGRRIGRGIRRAGRHSRAQTPVLKPRIELMPPRK